MRIHLVSTPTGANAFGVYPLGLLQLASWLNARTNHRADIVDGELTHPIMAMHENTADVIGFSAMTPNYEATCAMAKRARATFRRPILIGGVHISTLPQSIRPCFTRAIHGEGEHRLAAYLDGQEYTDPRPMSLDDYPPIDYDLVSPAYFRRRHLPIWEEQGVDAPIITSRGCPYHCVFCSTTRFWAGVRFYPVPWVVSEIRELAKRGATVISVQDDLFSMNRRRLDEIADRLIAEGLNLHLKYVCNVKSNTMTADMCATLRRMGVRIVNFGFESGNERVLQYLKCGSATVADHYKAIRLCREHGLTIIGSFIMGAEGETFAEKLDTLKLACSAVWHGADSLWHIALTPFPGTPIWEQAAQRGEVSATMNFDEIRMFSGRVWESIPRTIHWAMFILRAFMKIKRTVKSWWARATK